MYTLELYTRVIEIYNIFISSGNEGMLGVEYCHSKRNTSRNYFFKEIELTTIALQSHVFAPTPQWPQVD